ncbi:MAG: biosynthetic-type acetolactate synthase large subunit [Ruminiclostridium sp.]|nr:biosynthetic-type acetolactate synthase large subunit [Ruminiclostridium sp.]
MDPELTKGVIGLSDNKMTVARAMVECLKAEGVKHVFGYPGAAICPFYDELISSDIEPILVRHEVNAGHAASGYARVTGKAGVCIATSGPGALNLITAIATAYMDSIPIVAITGQVNSDQIGRDVFQEADITGSAEPFVKHSYIVKDPSTICDTIKKAFYIAETGRPGPVLIDVPMDVQLMETEFMYPDKVEIRSYKPTTEGNKLQIKRVADAILKADRPVICAGGGVFLSNAKDELAALAHKCDIPVVNTMMGISNIDMTDRLYFGMIGMHGIKPANYAVSHCDLLILLGARMGDRAVVALKNNKDMTIIHIDIDPAEIGKNVNVNTPVVGDIKKILAQLIETVTEEKHTDWVNELDEVSKEKKPVPERNNGTVCPKTFIEELNKQLPEDCIVVVDVGQNQIWTANNICLTKGRYMTAGGMGTMGYSLPAAIGAKKAMPERAVIAMCGDGALQMQSMELATAMQHGINVKLVVFVNSNLGMVRELQERIYGRETAVDLTGNPRFDIIAEAYGIKAENVTDISQAESAIKNMIDSEKPYLLQVIVDREERTII